MSDVLEKLQYIMDSPPHEHGGFHPGTVEIATAAHSEITTLRARLAEAEAVDEAAEALAHKYSRDVITLSEQLTTLRGLLREVRVCPKQRGGVGVIYIEVTKEWCRKAARAVEAGDE